MTRWLAVVGIGAEGAASLAAEGRALVEGAVLLVGGARHLAMFPDHPGERLGWAGPLSETVEAIAARRGRPVCVLATGDPMSYGIGVTLARRFGPEEMTVLPAVGAFALACARTGWAREAVATLTLHGRPLDLIVPHLAPGARLLVLSEDGGTPARLAARLASTGWGESRITVFERMGAADERVVEATARDWRVAAVDDLNTMAIECVAGRSARFLPRIPGLPDDAFEHDGQLTKAVVRAATLAALAPQPDGLLWDVGAGAGSVAIEWMRAARGARAIAIERDPGRVARIAGNAARLGVPGLRVVAGEAPEALEDLAAPDAPDAPDAVFVGGGITAPEVIGICQRALAPGGRLVANAVTVDGEAVLAEWQARAGGTLTRIGVTNLRPVGRRQVWKPAVPVTQWAWTRPRGEGAGDR